MAIEFDDRMKPVLENGTVIFVLVHLLPDVVQNAVFVHRPD